MVVMSRSRPSVNRRWPHAGRTRNARQFERADVAPRASGRRAAREAALIDVAGRTAPRPALVGGERNVGRTRAAGLIRVGKRGAAVVRQPQQQRVDGLVMRRRSA